MTPPHPFLEHPGVLAFAHRGGVGARPENTMAAFEAAVRLGYRYLETDVHATADGVLVAFHDHVLDRLTDWHGVIGALPWAEVRRARVDGREPIPLFEELLNAWPEVRINIDPKHDAAEEPLAAALERANALPRICIGSFSDARLQRLRRRLGPGLCTSMGPNEVGRLRFASWGMPTGRFAALCAQVPVRGRGVRLVDRAFITAAHRRNLQVHVWTINEEAEMERLLDLGVDGLMTDRLALLKDVLVRRGRWAGPKGEDV